MVKKISRVFIRVLANKMNMWRCPICHSELFANTQGKGQADSDNTSVWECVNKHSFDRAKQGYYNLLPVQQKRSKAPGDDKQMVDARHAFLSEGFYQPLVDKIASMLTSHVKDQRLRIYDAGCGTGYYLNTLCGMVSTELGSGHDISKFAISSAAKHYKHLQFVVASSINIPVQNSSQDIVIQVFSPTCEQEYSRILCDGGHLVIVEPAAEHLIEIKQQIYTQPTHHEIDHTKLSGFESIETQQISFKFALSDEASRLNLLMMTPYFWSASDLQKQSIINNCTSITADFVIKLFRKSVSDAK